MNVLDARNLGKQWVRDHRGRIAGYCGAIFAGSSNWLSPSMDWPTSSDLDIYIYQINPVEHTDFKKTPYNGIMLEPSYHNYDEFKDPYQVLRMPYIAPQFSRKHLIDDPYQLLTPIYRTVQANYKKRKWVNARLRHVYRKAKFNYEDVVRWENGSVFHSLLRFLGGIHNTANLLAVPTFQNLTLRKCLVTSDTILKRHKAEALQQDLLEILGSVHLSKRYIQKHLDYCFPMFDCAVARYKTPYWGDTEMHIDNKSKLFQGAYEMIDNGYHREAVFYILYIHHTCQSCIQNDGTKKEKDMYWPLFLDLSEKLELSDFAAVQTRATRGLKLLHRFHRIAKELRPV